MKEAEVTPIKNPLTALERWLQGNTDVSSEGQNNPLVPTSLIEKGVTPENIAAVNKARLAKGKIGNQVTSVYFGLNPLDIPLLELSEADPITGRIKWPTLIGIKRNDGTIDKENLENYRLTQEGVEEIMKAFPSLREELTEARRELRSA